MSTVTDTMTPVVEGPVLIPARDAIITVGVSVVLMLAIIITSGAM